MSFLRHPAVLAVGALVVAAACSSSGSSGGGSSGGDGSDAGSSSSGGGTGDGGSSTTDAGHAVGIKATDPTTGYSCGGGSGNEPAITFCAWGNAGPSTCLGDAALCKTVPFSFTLQIDSGFPVPLKASLWRCPVDKLDQCVPAMNESNGDALSGELRFGDPNGATGPHTTLTFQQLGPSAGTCTKTGLCPTCANATHIQVVDDYGNGTMIPFTQTFCCGSACP